MSSTRELAVCAIGIFFSYLFFGIIQEWITRHKYGENNERFTYTYCLVFVQCVANAIVSKVILSQLSRDSQHDTTSRWMYPMCALTYLCAMLASNEALQHVSYPTQVLGKSIKPVPVMLFGVFIARKRYHYAKYLGVLLIVFGIALFMHQGEKAGKPAAKQLDDPLPNHPYALIGFGEALLLISLAMDGLTGAIQDKMNANHKTHPHTMMYNMNLWSCVYLFGAIMATGEVIEFMIFVQKFPFVIWNMLLLSVLGAVGQHFIFTTITSFGPLKCSIITTTRKFFTILGSVIIFKNPMSPVQWLGSVLVFLGLALDTRFGKEIKHKPSKQAEKTAD